MTDLTRAYLFDTNCLSAFARADRFDELADLVRGVDCRTTEVVMEELRAGVERYPLLRQATRAEWLSLVLLDGIEDLVAFATWSERLGAGIRDRGEASVFAAAQRLDGIAICDDREAVGVARRYGLRVHGTLWLLSDACRRGKLSEAHAGGLIEELRRHGTRLPCGGGEFPAWARRHGLL